MEGEPAIAAEFRSQIVVRAFALGARRSLLTRCTLDKRRGGRGGGGGLGGFKLRLVRLKAIEEFTL